MNKYQKSIVKKTKNLMRFKKDISFKKARKETRKFLKYTEKYQNTDK